MPGMRQSCFLLIGLLLVVLDLRAGARAAAEHIVELPFLFSVEGTDVKTSACFRVREKIYGPDRAPWNSFRNQAQTSPETELTETIAAIQNKNNTRLKELLHSRMGRDPQWYKKQASRYFAQFERLRLVDVWGYYRFADHLVFFLKVELIRGPSFANFAFAREESGSLGFLPYGSKSLTFQFVSAWFHSPWGPAKSRSPAYCTPSLLERMTHKVLLDNVDRPGEWALELLFTGRLLADVEAEGEPYAALRNKISAFMNALRAGQMDEYFNGFTDRGRERVQAWYSSAQEAERRKYVDYVESLLGQDPFFVINVDPVFVVYTRTASSAVHALYFLRDENGRFRWANAAYATIIDNIFKGRSFKEAAREEKPFDSWRVNH